MNPRAMIAGQGAGPRKRLAGLRQEQLRSGVETFLAGKSIRERARYQTRFRHFAQFLRRPRNRWPDVLVEWLSHPKGPAARVFREYRDWLRLHYAVRKAREYATGPRPLTQHLQKNGVLPWCLIDSRVEKAEARLRAMPREFRAVTRRWIGHLMRQGYSRSTASNYELALRKFGVFLAQYEISFEKVNGQAVLAWIESERRRGLGPRSICIHVFMLRHLWKWLSREGLVKDDPIATLGTFRADHPLPIALEAQDVARLLSCLRDIRERALVELLYSTGCRLSEVARTGRQGHFSSTANHSL